MTEHHLTPEQSGASPIACEIVNETFLSLDGFAQLRRQCDDSQSGYDALAFAAEIARRVDWALNRDPRRELLAEAERVIRWASQEAAGKVRREVVGGWLHHADKIRQAIAKPATIPPVVVIDGVHVSTEEAMVYAGEHGCEDLAEDFTPAQVGDSIRLHAENRTGLVVGVDPCEWVYLVRFPGESAVRVVEWQTPHDVLNEVA
jgi:hypothetical protein